MTKDFILAAIGDELNKQFLILQKAVKQAHESATDDENIAENKYDTTGLEASYLVQVQARRLDEIEQSIIEFREFSLPENSALIQLGSLVKVIEKQNESFFFLSPQAGGMEIEHDGNTILITTFYSPIGKALLGKKSGDRIDINVAGKARTLHIESVE